MSLVSDAHLDKSAGKITLRNAILSLAAASVRGGYLDTKGLDLAKQRAGVNAKVFGCEGHRRLVSSPSISALWGQQVSVLLGSIRPEAPAADGESGSARHGRGQRPAR